MSSSKKDAKKDATNDSHKDFEPAVAVHRVLLAVTALQKKTNENAFRLEDIRTQAKDDSRLPGARFGRVGRGWILSFNKALDRMEKVRILQMVTLETVAFTEHATMVLSNSAHLPSIPNSSSEDENYYWRELIGFSKGDEPIRLEKAQQSASSADKRSISEDSFPNKRPKVLGRPKKKVTLSEAPKQKGKHTENGKKRGRPRKIQPPPQLEAEENADESVYFSQMRSAPPGYGDDEVDIDIENDDYVDDDDDDNDPDYGESDNEAHHTHRVSATARTNKKQRVSTDQRNEPDVVPHNASSSPQPIIHLPPGSYTVSNFGKEIVHHPGSNAPFPKPQLKESYIDGSVPYSRSLQTNTYNNDFNFDLVREQSWSRHSGSHQPSPGLPDQRTNNYDAYQSPELNDRTRTGPRYSTNTQSPAPSITPKEKGNLHVRTQATSQSEIITSRKSSGQSVAGGEGRHGAIFTPEGDSGTTSSSSTYHHQLSANAKFSGYGHNGGSNTNPLSTSQLSLPAEFTRLETLAIVSQRRDETIFALQETNQKLRTELSEARQSCERKERTNARTTQQLTDALREVNGLKRERAYTIDRLRAVKAMNEEAKNERDALNKEVGAMKEREADLEKVNRRLEGRINDLVRELEAMKRTESLEQVKEMTSPIDNLKDYDPSSHHADDNDDDGSDEDIDRTPTVSKSRTGNESHPGLMESAESSRSLSVRLTAAKAPGKATCTPNTTSPLLIEDNALIDSRLGVETLQETLETTVGHQITQNEPSAGPQLFISEQLEDAGKREFEMLTDLGKSIRTLLQSLKTQEEANRGLLDEARSARALLIELEQTDRAQMPARSSSLLESILHSAKNEMDEVTNRLAKGDAERKESILQLGKTQGGMDKLGDYLREERERSATLAAQLNESLGKTRSLEEELEYYRNLKTIKPDDFSAVCRTFTDFKELQLHSLRNLGLKIKSTSAPKPGRS